MTPSFFSFGRKRRDAALREDERKGARASVGSDQTASRRRFAADLGAVAAAPRQPEPAPAPEPPTPSDVDVDPTPKRWWQKTTGDLINERRARKGKAPINFNAA